MSQSEVILGALKLGPVCGTTMLEWYIPRYAARIHELRAAGWEISTRRCQLHDHRTPQTLYELVEIDQLRLAL